MQMIAAYDYITRTERRRENAKRSYDNAGESSGGHFFLGRGLKFETLTEICRDSSSYNCWSCSV